jgi:UDP-GlcNAc:undecaprenyl-phosphate GlcNAc-1-phosphate transferase
MLTLTPIAGCLVAFALAWAATPFAARIARRVGAVDLRTRRKIHAADVPRFGGIAIAFAFYVPVLVLALRVNLFQKALYAQPSRAAALLGGGLVILALGIFDDIRGARAWQKLMIQIPVAIFAWWAGIRIGGTAGPSGEFLAFSSAISLVTTVFWITAVINAINLIDGLDGLASGIALQALATTALCAWHREEPALALLTLVLAGSVGGFLIHNFNPAKIFMGDSGSMFLGYVLAVASVWSSQKAATTVALVLPAVALGLPLLDTLMAIVRRIASRRPVFVGDLDHVHHRLMRIGWSQRRTVLVLYGVGLIFSGLASTLIFLNDHRLQWPLVGVGALAALAFSVWLSRIAARSPAPAIEEDEVEAQPRRRSGVGR